MKRVNGKEVAEFVGMAAIVGSLIFVGLQMKQEQEIAQAQTLGDMIQNAIDAQAEVNQYTAIIVKANSGSPLDATETQILRNLVQIEEDRVFLQTLRMQSLDYDVITHELKFAAFLFRNPSARRMWLQLDEEMISLIEPLRTAASIARSRESGSYAFRARIKASLAKLDTLEESQ